MVCTFLHTPSISAQGPEKSLAVFLRLTLKGFCCPCGSEALRSLIWACYVHSTQSPGALLPHRIHVKGVQLNSFLILVILFPKETSKFLLHQKTYFTSGKQNLGVVARTYSSSLGEAATLIYSAISRPRKDTVSKNKGWLLRNEGLLP